MQRLGTSDAGEGWHPVRVSPAIEPAMSASASTPSHGRSASVGGGSPPVIAGPGASDSSKRSSVAGTKSSAKKPSAGGKVLPKWVPDADARICMECDKSFGLTVRRHHCRSCGHVVCKDCSGHKLILPFTHSQKPVRICDKCYKLLSPGATSDGKVSQSAMDAVKAANQSSAVGHAAALRKSAAAASAGAGAGAGGAAAKPAQPEVPADPRMQPTNVPAWTYAFKPFSEQGKSIGIGKLLVKVMGAENLPAMDVLGTSDPYCTIKLGDQERKTKAIMRTLNPMWNEEFVLDVTNATSTLKIGIWDHDYTGKDDQMGECLIPLADISHQVKFTKVCDIKLSDKLLVSEDGKKFEKKRKEKLESGVDITPRLYLELQYTFSKVGEFFSHFNPETELPAPPPDFNVDILYQHFWRLIALLGPIFGVLGSVLGVIGWGQPYLSLVVVLIYAFIALHPWVLTVLLQLLVIRYIVWQYVYRIWEKGAEEERLKAEALLASARAEESKHDSMLTKVGKAALSGTKAVLSAVPLIPVGKDKPLNENETAHLNSVVRGLANQALAAAGLKESLSYYQDLLGWLSDLIQWIYELFQWKNPVVTKTILLVLIGTTTYSLFFPHTYLWMAVGVYILTCRTVPAQFVLWLVLGLVRYGTRSTTQADSASLDRALTEKAAQTRLAKLAQRAAQERLEQAQAATATGEGLSLAGGAKAGELPPAAAAPADAPP